VHCAVCCVLWCGADPVGCRVALWGRRDHGVSGGSTQTKLNGMCGAADTLGERGVGAVVGVEGDRATAGGKGTLGDSGTSPFGQNDTHAFR
jgi:hypothetical protein